MHIPQSFMKEAQNKKKNKKAAEITESRSMMNEPRKSG